MNWKVLGSSAFPMPSSCVDRCRLYASVLSALLLDSRGTCLQCACTNRSLGDATGTPPTPSSRACVRACMCVCACMYACVCVLAKCQLDVRKLIYSGNSSTSVLSVTTYTCCCAIRCGAVRCGAVRCCDPPQCIEWEARKRLVRSSWVCVLWQNRRAHRPHSAGASNRRFAPCTFADERRLVRERGNHAHWLCTLGSCLARGTVRIRASTQGVSHEGCVTV